MHIDVVGRRKNSVTAEALVIAEKFKKEMEEEKKAKEDQEAKKVVIDVDLKSESTAVETPIKKEEEPPKKPPVEKKKDATIAPARRRRAAPKKEKKKEVKVIECVAEVDCEVKPNTDIFLP